MAVVKGPLFSLDARGSVGTSVVYSTWKGRNYVRRHAVPANPKSAGQLSVRAMLRFLSQYWDTLTGVQQTDWEDRAQVTNISSFNAFIAYNMTRWGLGDAPSKLDPADPTATAGSLTGSSATAQSRAIDIQCPMDTAADNWGIAIYRSLDSGLTAVRNELVRCIPADAVETFSWLDFPLTPGTHYYYKIKLFTDNGHLGDVVASVDATPLP